MNIELKPEQQRMLERAVQSGVYRNQDEVIEQAFELIRAQLHSEDWMSGRRQDPASQIATGFAQAERGELMDGEEAVRMSRQRRAERSKPARMSAAFQLTPQATEPGRHLVVHRCG